MGKLSCIRIIVVLIAALPGQLGSAEAGDIHAAVTAGDLEKVKKLLAEKPELAKAADGQG